MVELLVSIAIVFLMAGLLLALGASMRRSARRQACLVAFEHVKDAQTMYFSQNGVLLDEAAMVSWDTSTTPGTVLSTSWYVTVAGNGASARPLTSMEYFVLMARMDSSNAYAHLQLLGDLLVPSTEKNGPVIAGKPCYGTVRIYRTKADAQANANALYTLYDPVFGNPEVPVDPAGQPIKLDATNTGPLQTLVTPWGKEGWDATAWKTTANPVLAAQPFLWRPHELECRSAMADYDNTRAAPQFMWYANDAVVPPYLPFSEEMLVAAPGPDGVWARMNGANAATVAPHGLTNRGIAPGAQPIPPFDMDPSLLDAGAQDNLYSNQRAR